MVSTFFAHHNRDDRCSAVRIRALCSIFVVAGGAAFNIVSPPLAMPIILAGEADVIIGRFMLCTAGILIIGVDHIARAKLPVLLAVRWNCYSLHCLPSRT